MTIERVGFIGLGVMGYPMAGHLAQKGYSITVHNRTNQKAETWVEENSGTMATTPAELAHDKQVVCICVGNDEDLREVILGEDGVLTTLQPGSILVDHTTASASIAKEIYEHASTKGIGFLDAPISGGGVGAKNGTLTVMVGGDEEHFNAVRPLLACYAKTINLMGPVGSGQLTKMVNQICISVTLQGVAEALHFAISANLDVEKVMQVITNGTAQSWQLDNRGPWMLDERYKAGGFTVDLIKKDLDLCTKHASDAQIAIPIAKQVHHFFGMLQAQGKGDWDFSSLLELLDMDV